MDHLFISHSKHDKEIKKFFAEAIAKVDGLDFQMMELENWDYENVGIIIHEGIRYGCVGLVVLLGKHVQCPPKKSRLHTQNWISFEIGVAAGSGEKGEVKPIIVFEDYKDDINFPIPYLTDYIRYNLNNKDHFDKIGVVLKRILSNAMPADSATCPNPSCNAEYKYWSARGTWPCPACRLKFNYGEPINRDIPYRFDDLSSSPRV